MRPQGNEVLHIKLAIERGQIVTEWSSPDGADKRPIPTQVQLTQLDKLRKKTGRNLQAAKKELGKALNQRSWRKLRKALEKLQHAGDGFAWDLFGSNRKAVENQWRDRCHGWDRPDFPVPVVTISGPAEQLLPFEILPCFYEGMNKLPIQTGEVDIPSLLDGFLRQFLGFSCIIKRADDVAGEPVGRLSKFGIDVLDSEQMLAMKLFVCRSLRGVRQEEERLGTLNHKLDILAWPAKGQHSNAAELAGHLWNARHRAGLEGKHTHDQVHHFASHCDTSHADSASHYIGLAGCNRSRFSASLGEMNTAFSTLSREELPAAECRPLVFVNACGSSRISPNQVGSFPKLFLRQLRSRGFIGTETTMSDEVAAEFSYQFYERLLNGFRLGEALHDTRWHLVRRHNNPLGLFYTCYANPELCVSHPIE